MKLIIDISEEKYNTIKSDLYNTFPAEMRKWGLEAIRNGTPIPDNATNGDVIKAMFPNTSFSIFHRGLVDQIEIDMTWWNAPYQKGGK